MSNLKICLKKNDSNTYYEGIVKQEQDMNWAMVFTIVGVNIALIAAMATLVVWSINKLDSDVNAIGRRLDGHAARIDKLYQMFVDLLKEQKSPKTEP